MFKSTTSPENTTKFGSAGKKGLIVTIAVLMLFLSPVAMGVEHESSTSQQQERSTNAVERSAEAKERSTEAKAKKKHQLPAGELIGSKVKNTNDEEVGEIADLIVDSDNGQVPYAVVDFGGLFDFTRDDLFAIPFEALEHGHEDGVCVLNVAMVGELPGDQEKAEWLEVTEDEDAQSEKSPLGDFWIEPSSEAGAKVEHRTRALSANAILGSKVENLEGEEVGTLYELLVDLDGGNVVKTVFATGGVFGIGQERYLLPWKSLSHSRETGVLVTRVTKEMLETMPKYEWEKEPPSASSPPLPGS